MTDIQTNNSPMNVDLNGLKEDNPSVNEKRRILYIDRAKAIAMICVVLGHINLFDYYGYGNTNTDDCKIYALTSLFQLPLFMFLSGLVVSTRRRTFIDFIRQIYFKARSLLMPLIVIGGLYVLWAFGKYPWAIFTTGDLWGYWYLWCLFVFYVIHYCYEQFAARIEKTASKMAFDVVWFLCFNIMFKVGMKLLPDPDILSYSYIANLYQYFFLGVMIRKYKLLDKIFSNNHLFSLGMLLSCAFIIAHFLGISYPLAYQSFGIGMIWVVISTFYRLENHSNSLLKYLNFIGRNTLDVYIFHYFLISSFQNLWIGKWLHAGHYSPLTELFLAGIPAIMFCTISVYIGKFVRQSKILSKIIFNK